MKNKYIRYLLLLGILSIFWAIFTHYNNAQSTLIFWIWWYLCFVFIMLLSLTIPTLNLIDLEVKDFKKISWGIVFIIVIIAFCLAKIILFGFKSLAPLTNILNTAVFGIILGYGINRWEENRKTVEDKEHLINALVTEIGQNRYNCQVMIISHLPIPFQSFVWDSLKMNKHFFSLWQGDNSKLVTRLYNLYLAIAGANRIISMVDVAEKNHISAPNPTTKGIQDDSIRRLENYLRKDFLQELAQIERDIEAFRLKFLNITETTKVNQTKDDKNKLVS